MTRQPELIIRSAIEGNHIGYYCSSCGVEFALANDVTPKGAVIDLLRRFREHIQQNHTSGSADPLATTTAVPE